MDAQQKEDSVFKSQGGQNWCFLSRCALWIQNQFGRKIFHLLNDQDLMKKKIDNLIPFLTPIPQFHQETKIIFSTVFQISFVEEGGGQKKKLQKVC